MIARLISVWPPRSLSGSKSRVYLFMVAVSVGLLLEEPRSTQAPGEDCDEEAGPGVDQ
jgi:hypothetical protein